MRTTASNFAGSCLSAALLAACGGGAPPIAGTSAAGIGATSIPQWQASHSARRACHETREQPHCELLIIKTNVQPRLAGWGPSGLQAWYNLPSSTKGNGQIVAVVDAYDNPSVASDLATYRSYFGLPAANFTKYNQEGEKGHYPKGNLGWGSEIDTDVQMVSASCPNCTIYLIEADSDGAKNLEAAEKEAVKLGAHIISNSWGWTSKRHYNPSDFDSPGVTYLASGGDYAYGALYPADYASVIAVGGTLLAQNGSKYEEIVWPDTGGGCTSGVPKPSWQHDPDCMSRTGNDVAAVAFNVAQYDSYGDYGWETVGGTSVSSPLVAGIYGLAGNASSQRAGKRLWTLTKQELEKDLHYISEGNDSCPVSLEGSYLCTAGTGQYGTYSGPTGWGTPNGIGAF